MKDKALSPAIIGIIIAVVVAVIAVIGWRAIGPRTDGPTEPINMGKAMGGNTAAPPGK